MQYIIQIKFRQSCNTQLLKTRNRWRIKFDCGCISNTRCLLNLGCLSHRTPAFVEKVNKGFQCTKNQVLPHIVTSNSQITEINKYFANLTEFLKSLYNQRPLLNDGAKRNRLLSLKIMYTGVRKILCLHKNLKQLHFWQKVFFFLYYTCKHLHKNLKQLHFWQKVFFLHYTCKHLHKNLKQLHFWQKVFFLYYTCKHLHKDMKQLQFWQKIIF